MVAEPLGAAGAEGELSLGLLRRLVDTPDAFGSEVTMIAGERDGRPIVFVLMTGDHPAQVAGFADPARDRVRRSGRGHARCRPSVRRA